jgi:hypothetical protein
MTRAALELDTASSTEQEAPTTPGVEQRPDDLASTIASIRDHARRDPEGYLARTVVPEGGE